MTAPWLLPRSLAKGKEVFYGLFPPEACTASCGLTWCVSGRASYQAFPSPYSRASGPGQQVETVRLQEQARGGARKGFTVSSKERSLWEQPPIIRRGGWWWWNRARSLGMAECLPNRLTGVFLAASPICAKERKSQHHSSSSSWSSKQNGIPTEVRRTQEAPAPTGLGEESRAPKLWWRKCTFIGEQSLGRELKGSTGEGGT